MLQVRCAHGHLQMHCPQNQKMEDNTASSPPYDESKGSYNNGEKQKTGTSKSAKSRGHVNGFLSYLPPTEKWRSDAGASAHVCGRRQSHTTRNSRIQRYPKVSSTSTRIFHIHQYHPTPVQT